MGFYLIRGRRSRRHRIMMAKVIARKKIKFTNLLRWRVNLVHTAATSFSFNYQGASLIEHVYVPLI